MPIPKTDLGKYFNIQEDLNRNTFQFPKKNQGLNLGLGGGAGGYH